jgi:rubrerythrin
MVEIWYNLYVEIAGSFLLPYSAATNQTSQSRQLAKRLVAAECLEKEMYSTRTPVLDSVRGRVFERFYYLCVYCGDTADVIDHVIPWSYCHTHDEENLVASCSVCNEIASDKVFDSLQEKTNYIKAIRSGQKWTRKTNNKKIRIYYCTECGVVLHPCINGSTNFLCPSCAKIFT